MTGSTILWLVFSSFIITWLAVGQALFLVAGVKQGLTKNPFYKLIQLSAWPKLLSVQAADLREVSRLQAKLREHRRQGKA